MRLLPTAFLLVLLPLISAAEVQPGDTLAQVRAALGAPRGQAEAADRLVLYYERGEVELQAGVVTRVTLLSPAAHEAAVAQRAAEAQRVRDEQDLRRADLRAEGEARKARQLADPVFRTATPEQQVAFWDDFSRRYPDVPASEELLHARLRLSESRAQAQRQTETAEHLARLEARVKAAEARAEEAERTRPYYSFHAPRYRPRHPQNLWPIDYGDFNFSHPLGTPVDQLGGSILIKDQTEKTAEIKSRYLQRDRDERSRKSRVNRD